MLKYRIYLIRHKRKVKIMAQKYRGAMLFVLICVFIISVFMMRREKKSTANAEETFAAVMDAITSADTEQNVCALTFNVAKSGSDKDISLTFEVLSGLNVPAVCFADTEWMTENKDTVRSLEEKNIEFGLLFSKETDTVGREDTTLMLAGENEKFYSVCGKYPRFVRVVSKNKGLVPAVLQVFHQYDISYSVMPVNKETPSVTSGDICSLGYVTQSTPYTAARFIAAIISKGLTVVSLEEMLGQDVAF